MCRLTALALTLSSSWTRYKINRPAFHRKYAQFFESMKSYPTNPPLNGDMLKWLPLMFIVVSVSA